MNGHHEVRTFTLRTDGPVSLPEGWKPFAAFDRGHYVLVVCRSWKRAA